MESLLFLFSRMECDWTKNKSRDKEEVRRQGGIGAAHASIGASLTPGLSDPLLR